MTILRGLESLEQKSAGPSAPTIGKSPSALARWTVVSTSLIYILFAMTVGAMISDSIVPSGQIVTENDTLINPVSMSAYIAGLFALILCAIYFRPSGIMAYEKSDYRATNWGLIWVILSGVVFVGAGIGMMVAVRTMGG